jgi:thiol-disulfide isomerase/thioredoxin
MKKFAYILIGLLVLAGVVYIIVAPPRTLTSSAPGKYDSFAQCIKDSGAIFYGAFWCPHCQAQKAEFGSSAHLLPYVECSTPDGQSQNALCNSKGISEYPTWQFPNSTTTTPGVLELSDLAQRTGCTLPQ